MCSLVNRTRPVSHKHVARNRLRGRSGREIGRLPFLRDELWHDLVTRTECVDAALVKQQDPVNAAQKRWPLRMPA